MSTSNGAHNGLVVNKTGNHYKEAAASQGYTTHGSGKLSAPMATPPKSKK